MSDAGKCWKLFGKTFCMAMCETGRFLAESTHDGLAYLAEKTDPNRPKALVASEIVDKEVVANSDSNNK